MMTRRLSKFFLYSIVFLAGFPSVVFAPVHAREMMDMDFVRLRSLDKITARTVTFETQVGSTLSFGNVFIKVQACRKASPIEEPESAAFLQVWEGAEGGESEWVFSGWMFASSPGLSHMDHPVYDVWVLDCFSENAPEPETVSAESESDEAPAPIESDALIDSEGDEDIGDDGSTQNETIDMLQ